MNGVIANMNVMKKNKLMIFLNCAISCLKMYQDEHNKLFKVTPLMFVPFKLLH